MNNFSIFSDISLHKCRKMVNIDTGNDMVALQN